MVAWELSTLAQQPYEDLTPLHLTEYLKDGYRLSQPPTCPDVLYQLMAFCWALNPNHRPRAALLVDYLTGLNQEGINSAINTSTTNSSGSNSVNSNHIPISSFIHRTTGVAEGGENKQHSDLTGNFSTVSSSDSSASATNGFTLGPSRSMDLAGSPVRDVLGPYCQTLDGPANIPPPGLSHFPSTVYSTPTSLAGDLPWKLPEKPKESSGALAKLTSEGSAQQRSSAAFNKPANEVPPPLPPANPSASCPLLNKTQRPQLPLPSGASHTHIL